MTPPPADTAVATPPKVGFRAPFGGEVLTRGIVLTWLSLIVLIPLGAVVLRSTDDGLSAFWNAISEPEAVAAIKLTVIASLIIVAINAVMGTLIAWVMVRDDFRGKRLVNSVIDLPFALPTIVAGLTLLALYGEDSPVGISVTYTRIAVGLALLFVTLPFVIRAVQPVLHEIDEEMEEAAASLGASNTRIFRSIILPNLTPAIVAGCALAFARAIGEFGPSTPRSHPSTSSAGSRATTPLPPPRSRCFSW
jgi:sulfate/thiosulfate transport system permease protein